MAFLTYLEEHPATQVLADEFTDVLMHLGCLPGAQEEALA